MRNKSRISNNIDPAIIFLVLATLLGGYIRFFLILQSDFPLNDGGLFFTMTKDLIANNFHLPLTTTYNHINIPYAYPPLMFYLTGVLIDITSWNLIDILRILPALFSVITIPAFYLLANSLINNKFQVILATLIFTFIPATFDWLIMGGGLTRSPAFFFAILSLFFIYRLYTRNHIQDILWTAFFSSLTILSHPDTALHTAASALVFFCFYGRNKKGVIKSIIVVGGILLGTAPWWYTVIINHGIAPFISAGKTGDFNVGMISQFLNFNLTREYGLKTIGTTALIGIFWYLSKRKYFIPIWTIIIFISGPRSAPLFISLCIAFLASYSLSNIFQIFDNMVLRSEDHSFEGEPLNSKISKGLFLLLLSQWFYSAMATIIGLSTIILTKPDINAFDWIKYNTLPESRFLVLTAKSPLSDPVSEWFPALTERTSINTVQGFEWDSNRSFNESLYISSELQNCIYFTYHCIESWAEENQIVFDYIYIHLPVLDADHEIGSPFESAFGDLSLSKGITEIIYKNDDVSIYKVLK